MKSAALHAFSLARFSILYIRGAAANHAQRWVRLATQVERLREECAQLREEVRIKDARMERISPQRRLHHGPQERMAILLVGGRRSGPLLPMRPRSRGVQSMSTSMAIQSVLDRSIRKSKAGPKHLICDKGKQFWRGSFKEWCERKRIRPRFGAVGKRGGIAVVERLISNLKSECMDLILVPFPGGAFCQELRMCTGWYNRHRPHSTLSARTPAEVYGDIESRTTSPRIEPRARWPLDSLCASPQAPVMGKPGTVVQLRVGYHAGRKHLLIAALEHAA